MVIARERKEDIAPQQSPITTEMFMELQQRASKSHKDSLESVVFDIFCLIIITGFRVTEYTQKTRTPSGKRGIKAFISTNWKFHDEKGKLITTHTLEGDVRMPLQKVKIIFRIQKNRKNGQLIKNITDDDHPEICPAKASYRIF